MEDKLHRKIDYLRISVTDRCNLRCVYCMPENGIESLSHFQILRYEEIVRLCRIFASLGVTKIKLTGGEPLVRRGLSNLVSQITSIEGIRSCTITTNGVLLAEQLPALLDAGLTGVNISLDTMNAERFEAITRRNEFEHVMAGLHAALSVPGFNVKINCVPTKDNCDDWVSIAGLARGNSLAVRFIELMPIGLGAKEESISENDIRKVLENAYGPLTDSKGPYGNGPCHYTKPKDFIGDIGFISAMSHSLCSSCNRVRLTADGFLKTCLQFDTGISLRNLLEGNATDEEIRAAIQAAVFEKPAHHLFLEQNIQVENMNKIGG